MKANYYNNILLKYAFMILEIIILISILLTFKSTFASTSFNINFNNYTDHEFTPKCTDSKGTMTSLGSCNDAGTKISKWSNTSVGYYSVTFQDKADVDGDVNIELTDNVTGEKSTIHWGSYGCDAFYVKSWIQGVDNQFFLVNFFEGTGDGNKIDVSIYSFSNSAFLIQSANDPQCPNCKTMYFLSNIPFSFSRDDRSCGGALTFPFSLPQIMNINPSQPPQGSDWIQINGNNNQTAFCSPKSTCTDLMNNVNKADNNIIYKTYINSIISKEITSYIADFGLD